MDQIKIVDVWSNKSEELIQEIVDTWKKVGALPNQVDPFIRAKQVVLVARNEDNEIVGITTAKKTYYTPLKNDFYFFRGLLLPDYRIPGLFINMTIKTFERLEEFNYALIGEKKPLGVITEVENPRLKKANLTKLSSGMVLIGFSTRGNPIYVYYFKGARYLSE